MKSIVQILEWLNYNSDFLTLLTVLVSLVTCIFGFCSIRAAWVQVREMQKQYNDDNRANIEIEFIFQ